MVNMGSDIAPDLEKQPQNKSSSNPFGYKYYPEFLKKATHPGMCLLHFFFKVLAIGAYFFLNLFIGNKTMTFITVILFAVFDFWSVKNLTGRMLVGLRWWSQVNADGTEEWKFEGLDEKKSGGVDSFIFWGVLYVTPIIWIVLLVSSVLSINLSQVTLCAACIVLAGTNLFGYIKCSKDHKKNMGSFFASQAAKNISAGDMVKLAGYAANK